MLRAGSGHALHSRAVKAPASIITKARIELVGDPKRFPHLFDGLLDEPERGRVLDQSPDLRAVQT